MRASDDIADERPTLLEARDVHVELDGTSILRGASLTVERGEVHVLIGPNGAGKTTFANAITGHVPVSGGSITLAGAPLGGTVSRRVEAGIGRKFQVPRVFGRLTAFQNLAVAARGEAFVFEGSDGAEQIGIAEPRARAELLSHGGRQRLELKMVLSQRPAIAVLDEPTAGMTRAERAELASIIRDEAEQHTFLIVEHDMDFVASVADRVSFMRDGEVIASGTYAEIAANPVVREVYLGEGATTRGGTRTSVAGGRGSLSVAGLCVRRGPLDVIRDISVALDGGGALGVLGRNGAGKTTLLHGLMGLLPTTGSVQLDGQEIGSRPSWWRSRRGIALVPQGRQLFPALTVQENLALASSAPAADGPTFDVHSLFPALARLAGRRAGLLSGGEQQQVAIARALLRRPLVLLLDEPTEGLAPAIVEEITTVLDHLVAEGLSIVLAEQQRAVVEGICSTFLVLRGGEAAGGGEVDAATIDAHYAAL